MAYQSIWYFTDLPDDVVNILNNDLFYKYSSLDDCLLGIN